jgi:hypothetical protein
MSEEETQLATALARCTMMPGTWDKRFARDIAAMAHQQPAKELTPNQRRTLMKLVVRYRRQIADERLVKVAEQSLTPPAALNSPSDPD